MDADSIYAGGIEVAPAVALTAIGIEVGVTSVGGVGVVREMKGSMPLAHGALHREIMLRIATRHVLKRTGIGVVPVAHCFLSLSETILPDSLREINPFIQKGLDQLWYCLSVIRPSLHRRSMNTPQASRIAGLSNRKFEKLWKLWSSVRKTLRAIAFVIS